MEVKLVTLDNLEYFYEKLQNEKGVFIGTQEDYDAANSAGKIKTGSLVIILDPDELEKSTVTALLGTGILGKMILGQK
jgi:hypothetical protein